MPRTYFMTAGYVASPDGRAVDNGSVITIRLTDAEAGTVVPAANLRRADGTAWPAEGVSTDEDAKIIVQVPGSGPFPDRLYADTGRARWEMLPVDLSARVTDLEDNPAGLTDDQAAVVAAAARVVGGVLVDPDGDPIEVGATVTAETITSAGGVLAADAVESVADNTVLTLGVTTDNDPALAVSTSTVLANGSTDGVGHIPFIVDGEVVFIDVPLTALAAIGAATGVPGAPTGLTATPGVQEVALSWTAPADHGDSAISDYTVQYRIGTGSWTPFTHTASTATTITVTGLTADTAYEFRVKAVNTQGASLTWSSPTATATPTAPLTVSQHDTFDRSDAGVIGVSDDGYSWAVTPLPNIVSDPTGATPSSGWSIGIRSNHLATISQPGGGAYLISRTAPADDGASPPVAVGYHARWRIPTNGSPFTRNIRYVACFVDYQNFLYVQGDQLRAMVNGTISSLGNGTGYGSLAGMVVGVEVNAARTQARLRVDASDDGGVSWPESIRTFGSIPVSLRGSDVVGIMSTFVDGGTPPYLLTDEFWVAPV